MNAVKNILITFLSFFLLISLFSPKLAWAGDDDKLLEPPPVAAAKGDEQLGCGEGFGHFAKFLCDNPDTKVVGNKLNDFLSKILGFLTIIAALYFFFQLVTAGIAWIGSGGDKTNIEAARNKIMNAILGLVIVAGAWVFVGVIGTFIGLKILDPGSLIDVLKLNP